MTELLWCFFEDVFKLIGEEKKAGERDLLYKIQFCDTKQKKEERTILVE